MEQFIDTYTQHNYQEGEIVTIWKPRETLGEGLLAFVFALLNFWRLPRSFKSFIFLETQQVVITKLLGSGIYYEPVEEQ